MEVCTLVPSPQPPALAVEQVRWYSYRAAWDPTDVSKLPEIPHRGSLLRFAAADSAALELSFRERQDELERAWWEEEASLLTKAGSGAAAPALPAPAGEGAAAAAVAAEAVAAAAAGRQADTLDWAYFVGECPDNEPAVLVRSGAFEVCLRSRLLRPCYWPAARHRVLRGTWFAEKSGEWVPLKESLADQLEEGYQQAIWLPARGRLQPQPGGGEAARLDLNSHVDKGLYALFASEEEMWLCQETGWGWLRKVGVSATAGQTRLRLRRGYEQPATKAALDKEADVRQEELDDASAGTPVSRLVLVVHGIGQKLEAANIAQDAASFRSVLRQVAQDQGQQGVLDEQAVAGRTEVLPVQWRKQLHIEADALSRQLMPPGIPSLRQVLHSTVVELLLYMTPHYRADIVASLVASLNGTYSRFMRRNPGFQVRFVASLNGTYGRFVRRNPGFQGTVSILAHSLGSVLCYDILCCQPQAGPQPALPPPGSCTPPPQHAQQAQQAGVPRGSEGGEDSMVIDLTVDSPTSALQQELSRLRAENQRLQLQLEVARAEGPSAAGSGSPWSPQHQQGRQLAVGSAPAAYSLPPTSPATAAAAQQQAGQQQAQAGVSPAARSNGEAALWPHLQFSVDQLILLGSPLGCFLALRGVSHAKGAGLGSPASAPLMQLAPGQPFTPDGLPTVSRLYNLYHPYDPVGHRLEPLAQPASAVQRAAFIPLFKGGKRIHLAVQEFQEDMGSAASRLGTSLLSSLAFSKFKSSKSFIDAAAAAAGGEGGSGAAEAEEEAATAAAEAAAAAAEEEAARRMPGSSSAPVLDGSSSGAEALFAEGSGAGGDGQPYTSLTFGALGSGAIAAPAAAPAAASPAQRSQHGGSARSSTTRAAGGSPVGASAGVARVVGWPGPPGSKTAQGRLDFVMQESSLENQYLSALSAHFNYWTSADVALFVLRAVHGLDVLTGAAPQQAQQAAQQAQQQQAQQQQQQAQQQQAQQQQADADKAASPGAAEAAAIAVDAAGSPVAGARRRAPVSPRQLAPAL